MIDTNAVHPNVERLAAFVAGALTEQESVDIETHLSDCDSCRTVLENLPQNDLDLILCRTPPFSGYSDRSSFATKPPSFLAAAAAPHSPTWTDGSTPGLEPDRSRPARIPAELANHPRYHVLEPLGSGGMGTLYKAKHAMMDRVVALKVIRKRLMADPASVERFRREVKAAARLVHPNIVTAYDAEQAGDLHFLVMELVDGQSLDKFVRERGPLPVAEACDYIRQAALGLQHAYECGMVHRDIKPHNLMLTAKGQIKILDFGLARFVQETGAAASSATSDGQTETVLSATRSLTASDPLTEHGMLMGTPDFMAPEQTKNPSSADIRADIYSLGCTFYYLLSGSAPFHTETFHHKLTSHCETSPPPLTGIRQDIQPAVLSILDHMMAKLAQDRFQTPIDVARALGLEEKERNLEQPAYRLIERIGVGSLSEVWRAQNPGGVEVAVKICRLTANQDEGLKALPDFKKLSHPYLLSVHESWICEAGFPHIAMQLADWTLRDLLRDYDNRGQEGIPMDELLPYMAEAADALDYIHGKGLVHANIKPENIFITEAGHAMVGDFGFLRHSNGWVGTLEYIDPECINSSTERFDKWSDQYSLAITYFELRTNRRPYFPLNGPAVSFFYELETSPDISVLEEAERNVLLKALAKNPEQRYPSCLKLVEALKEAVSEEPSSHSLAAYPLPKPVVRRRKRKIRRFIRRHLLEVGNALAISVFLYLVGLLGAVRAHIKIDRPYQSFYLPALGLSIFGLFKLLTLGWDYIRSKDHLKSKVLLPWIAVAVFFLACIVLPGFISLWKF
jgi:serine/threonine protein kinase